MIFTAVLPTLVATPRLSVGSECTPRRKFLALVTKLYCKVTSHDLPCMHITRRADSLVSRRDDWRDDWNILPTSPAPIKMAQYAAHDALHLVAHGDIFWVIYQLPKVGKRGVLDRFWRTGEEKGQK